MNTLLLKNITNLDQIDLNNNVILLNRVMEIKLEKFLPQILPFPGPAQYTLITHNYANFREVVQILKDEINNTQFSGPSALLENQSKLHLRGQLEKILKRYEIAMKVIPKKS